MSAQISRKLVLLGHGGVGKTSLVNRYVHQRFQQRYLQTLGEDVFSKKMTIEEYKILVAIHDLAGQERFSPFRQTYIRGAHLALGVFDLTIPSTLNELKENWLDDLSKSIDPKTKFYLTVVGNKSDLKRKINKEGEQLVKFIKKHYKNIEVVEYIETSAKENVNVELAFLNLVSNFIKNNKRKLSQFCN